ncbi:Protein disulfide-isomerase 2 [Tetrabaena socialis]|uniref:Protein disulfide-isomerase 2 n=1 Tax=Tetrabaena socialis TaxID=47790 RepID=A0A2J8AA22_9CHLO|nr:Protein disulfide-isomerase 2 [Tetrabaena socialis]|eukprot:PNH09378.1 Protein disulfide-isomerase 2 [Tetrabaena socialis]
MARSGTSSRGGAFAAGAAAFACAVLAAACLLSHPSPANGQMGGQPGGAAGMPPAGSTMPPAGPWVTELNLFNLRGSIGDGRMWFVMYYVPWCRSCKRMTQEWDKLAQEFSANRDIAVARFDCMQDEAMCDRLGIEHTPALILYRDGKKLEWYQADFYHSELLIPFLRRMHAKYFGSPQQDTADPRDGPASVAAPAAAERQPPQNDDGGAAQSEGAKGRQPEGAGEGAQAAASNGAVASAADGCSAGEGCGTAGGADGAEGLARRGRHGGPAVEALQLDREEL